MWLIRAEQLRAFEDVALARFERDAVAHLHRALPERCTTLGPSAVARSVRRAIIKARGYGITSELDVLKFLNLMYLLDFDFDTDPRFAWAADRLNAEDVEPSVRLQLILDRATRELAP
ncbi:MAG TPA: hypothetical protein VGL81_24575 [Polyangiaceae bacterium]